MLAPLEVAEEALLALHFTTPAQPLFPCHFIPQAFGNGSLTTGNFLLHHDSFLTLRLGKWLNDEAIDAYLIILSLQEGRARNAHPDYIPSWCYQCAFSSVATQAFHLDPTICNTYNYTLVKRWSKRVFDSGLHNLQALVIPNNLCN